MIQFEAAGMTSNMSVTPNNFAVIWPTVRGFLRKQVALAIGERAITRYLDSRKDDERHLMLTDRQLQTLIDMCTNIAIECDLDFQTQYDPSSKSWDIVISLDPERIAARIRDQMRGRLGHDLTSPLHVRFSLTGETP